MAESTSSRMNLQPLVGEYVTTTNAAGDRSPVSSSLLIVYGSEFGSTAESAVKLANYIQIFDANVSFSALIKKKHQNAHKNGSKGSYFFQDLLLLYHTVYHRAAKRFNDVYGGEAAVQTIDREMRMFSPFLSVHVCNISEVTLEALLASCETSSIGESLRHMVVFLISTHTDGSPPTDAIPFFRELREAVYDFRVGKLSLSSLMYVPVGFGSLSEYSINTFCRPIRRLDRGLQSLGAMRMGRCIEVDDECSLKAANEAIWGVRLQGGSQFAIQSNWMYYVASYLYTGYWRDKMQLLGKEAVLLSTYDPWSMVHHVDASHSLTRLNSSRFIKGEGSVDAANRVESEVDDEEDDEDEDSASVELYSDNEDVEEMGRVLSEQLTEKKRLSMSKTPEMLNEKQSKQLQKEGYKLVGSHSAVKLCRWTKAQLRGRGGCYKHTFYGITSYQCMEATPSLACANKCVFCWRHHKNPVGTSWRWKEDDPLLIIEEWIKNHVKMIHELKGMQGIKLDRYKEAHTVRHCALSLVGEPIMYPKINTIVRELHKRRISTFLVTNAQLPEAIESLVPVTQLYVSVDAADRDSLKKIDRPLFKDFWERFLASLDALHAKQQRTVYRLTIVRGYNMQDVSMYAKLVERGHPDFIEIKAVTYCGTSKGSDLTMKNVPWYEEVLHFAEALCKSLMFVGRSYEIACEHKHSSCILIAQTRYKIRGQWHTWIDYDKFHGLVHDKSIALAGVDYCAPTPDWAIYKSEEQGFDPLETRTYTKGKYKRVGGNGNQVVAVPPVA